METQIFDVLAKIPNRSRTENSQLLNSWRELRKCRQLRRKRSIAVGRLSSQIQNTSTSAGLSACPKDAKALSQRLSKNAPQIESHSAESASTLPTNSIHQAHTLKPAWPWDNGKDIPEQSTRLVDQVTSICNSSSSSSRSSMASWMSSLASKRSSNVGKRGSRTTFRYSTIIFQDDRLELTYHSQGKARSSQGPQADHEQNFTTKSFNTPSLLSSAEQEVWNQLIDEEALSQPLYQTCGFDGSMDKVRGILPSCFIGVNLVPSSCNCGKYEPVHMEATLSEYRICKRCGSSLMHRMCRDFNFPFLKDMEINNRDYFDNSALHYLARQDATPFGGMRHLILNGCDPRSRNASGSTFLHVLNWDYVWDLLYTNPIRFQDFIHMVESLSTWNFDFHNCDCFGRTISHEAFFARVTLDEAHIRISKYKQIISILKTDVSKEDIFGVTVHAIICHLNDRAREARKYSVVGESVSALLTHYYKKSIPLHEILLYEPDHFLLAEGYGISHECASYIDINGDTLLFRALKVREHMPDEKFLEMKIRDLLRSGSNIHQRNRDGDTVLSVATSQGLPTIVNLLLSEGANPNSEQFRSSGKSQSLLCHAEMALARAKRQHDYRRYAGIMSCIKLITEAGAVATPSLLQRWGNKTIRERIAREGEAFSSSIIWASRCAVI